MIFHSTYPENLNKRFLKKVIGSIVLDGDGIFINLQKKIKEYAGKAIIDIKKVKFYTDKREDDEGCYENVLIFYYEVLESDDEYNKRIESLQVKDLSESLQEIRRFRGCVRQKKELYKLYLKLAIRGNYQGLIDKDLNSFFEDESPEEKVQKAYDKGYQEGKKELEEFKKKIKDL